MNFLKYMKRFKRWRFPLRRRFQSSVVPAAKLFRDKKFSLDAVKEEFPVGRQLHGFTVTEVQDIAELHLTAVGLTHDSTGANYLHLAREDRNNVFSVGFRTVPMNNTGAPHILEHLALCGSQKFPCRDPFFKMLHRSLATFMNAFTASDYTMYPFSSQNAKDFENLLLVYLDSAFYPQLKKLDFLQEGWRLEHESVDDTSSPIILKGVVFNEMKGAFADSDSIFCQALQNKLLPSHTYSFVSGGDPLSIPRLTWEQLKQFHTVHYHPCNARFFTYGDFPLTNHLRIINEQALTKFARIPVNTSIPDEEKWTTYKKHEISCPVDNLVPNMEKQTTVSVSYLLGSITDSFEVFVLYVLSELLIDGPNSPFYKSLVEPNIGAGLSPSAGYNNNTKQAYFSVGLKGIHPNDAQRVVDIIEHTVDEIISNGFPKERIDTILHNIELSIKHQTSNFGLALLMGLYPVWNHGGNPMEALAINSVMLKFKDKLVVDPQFLQNKAKQYLKDNMHKLVLTMSPKDDYEVQRKAEEKVLLKEHLAQLNAERLKDVYLQGLTLRNKQDENEDLTCLPSLKLSDIDPHIPRTQLQQLDIGGVKAQLTAQPTNGLAYFKGVLNTKCLAKDEKELLPLFCHVLTRMGTKAMDYKQFAQKVDLTAGGMNASTHLCIHPVSSDVFEEGILLSSYSLLKNTEAMMSLWSELFQSINLLDVARLRTLASDLATQLAVGLPENGHHYAMTRAGSVMSQVGQLKEIYSGVDQINVMKRIAEMEDMSMLATQLQNIALHCMNKSNLRVSLNTVDANMQASSSTLTGFIQNLPDSPSMDSTQMDRFVPRNCKQHIILPYPVGFVSKSHRAVPFSHEDFSKLQILSRLLSAKFLHREIREKGSAYGSGARVQSGLLTFYSYRDPNNSNTLKVFNSAADWALNCPMSEQDIGEAKLQAFSEIDKPIAPGEKGQAYFQLGISDDMVETYRKQLLSVTSEDLRDVTNRYLKGSSCSGEVILGPENPETCSADWEICR